MLMSIVKVLVYAESEEILNSKYKAMISNQTAVLYPKFLSMLRFIGQGGRNGVFAFVTI